MMGVRAERKMFDEGYALGVAHCLKILAKWFFMSNKDAKAARDEMMKLLP
jgi:hypothetical protein